MDAYGTTANLNELNFQPGLLRVPQGEYSFTVEHLVSRWGILVAYMLVCLAITAWRLKQPVSSIGQQALLCDLVLGWVEDRANRNAKPGDCNASDLARARLDHQLVCSIV